MLPDDIVIQVVKKIMPSRGKAVGDGQDMAGKGDRVLPKVIKRYVAEKQGEWTEKTKMEVSSVFRLLEDVIGNVDVTNITKPMVVDLRSTLQRLPPNIYKKYPGKTIQQVMECEGVEPMSTKSVNKHVARLGALLRYCMDEGMITSNPASGLKISEKKRADEERSAYDKDDIANIIRSLPKDQATPERYWISLIGLYSGMRLNEICQLYVADIVRINEYWCFSINGENDKRLKNAASERVIPIHPVLLELGFLNYVKQLELQKVPRLWMNLTWMDIHGYSNGFGKWYQRFNRIHVTADPKKVFHSMRHTVTDMLKQAGVVEAVIAELVGHSNGGSMTMGRYGKRYQPKVLLEALMHLDYGIDIPKWNL
jgi:integrase